MEKILDFGKRYKYEIIGAIVICILYIGIKLYSVKEKEEEKVITKEKVTNSSDNKKELRVLISEIRKMSAGMKEMMQYNRSLNPKDNYFSFRNEYLTRDIEKMRILIDTKSMGPHNDDEHSNTSDYKVVFGYSKGEDPIPLNTICFGDKLNNIIGFRLTRATIPDTLYNVTPVNKTFKFTLAGSEQLTGILNEGSYTFQSLAVDFERALNEAITGSNPCTITSDTGSFKYTINYTGGGDLTFFWSSTDNQVHKLVGGSVGLGGSEIITTSELPYTFKNTVDHSVHFADLVIDEIPSIATKLNANGRRIVDRIPLTGISGTLTTYIPLEEGTPWTQNYFYPINITQLSVKIFDDTSTNLLQNNNNDHMLEFEIAMLKNTKLLK